MRKLFFDDDVRRHPKDGWTCVLDVPAAIEEISKGDITFMSLDHDIEDSGYGCSSLTGYDLCQWMVDRLPPAKWPHTIVVHSHNETCTKRMVALLEDFKPRLSKVHRIKWVSKFSEKQILEAQRCLLSGGFLNILPKQTSDKEKRELSKKQTFINVLKGG